MLTKVRLTYQAMARETAPRTTAPKWCVLLASTELATRVSSLQEEEWTTSIHLGAKTLLQIQLELKVLLTLTAI